MKNHPLRAPSWACVACLLVIVASCNREPPVTNADVLKLAQSGFSDDLILARVREAKDADFKLDPDSLAQLKQAKVSEAVMLAMMQRASGTAPAPPAAAPAQATPAVSTAAPPPTATTAAPVETASAEPATSPRAGLRKHEVRLVSSTFTKTLREMMGEGVNKSVMGYGANFINYPGRKARVRTTDKHPALLVESETDPERQYLLVTLKTDEKEGGRNLLFAHSGSFSRFLGNFTGRSSRAEEEPDRKWIIKTTTKDVSETVWRVTPAADLPPGEYGVWTHVIGGAHGTVYDFAVDE